MGLVSRAMVAGQFKLGILQARQITRIENGGLVIACADSRYQPDIGVRYEMTPDDWFLHTYAFFPRDFVQEIYERDFVQKRLYYDYFSDAIPLAPRYGDCFKRIFAIFKDGHDTGYRIIESSYSVDRGGYRQGAGSRYSGLHINQWGISRYKDSKNGHMRPFVDARYIGDAAMLMMADLDEFEREIIDLKELAEDCASGPGSCVLHELLVNQLDACRFKHKYVKDLG